MVDREFCNSSFLAFRYIGKPGKDFSEKLHYRYPPMPSDKGTVIVDSADEIDTELRIQTERIKKEYKKIGILLSGGMDSSILASYFPGVDAYTFRFLGGSFQQDELIRAESYAKENNNKLHYVDINWGTVEKYLKPVMLSKGGPVHSIEPQICHAAKQAINDDIDIMIIGDASDYVFGGMDKLLSQDWSYEAFIRRYIYVEPAEVLNNPIDVQFLFNNYKTDKGIEFVRIIKELAAQESYGSYENAFSTAGLEYYDPYEKLRMSKPLDLSRVRNGESKYLIRELFKKRYPNFDVPEKKPMPRPVDEYFRNWEGPTRKEFRKDIDISKYDGNQKWLLWCLEEFLNMIDGM